MTRLLVLASSYPRDATDPAGRFVQESCAELRAAGLPVEIIAPHGGDVAWPIPQGLFGAGIPEALERAPARAALDGAVALARLRRILRQRLRPGDAILAHWLPLGLAVADLAPTGVWAHGGGVALLERAPGGRRLARRLDAHARQLVFVSADLRQRFEALLGRAPRATTAVVPMGVPPARPCPKTRARLRALAQGRPIVATVGRLVPIKGLDVLAEALGARRDVIWCAAGVGPSGAELGACPAFTPLGLLDPPARDALLAEASVFVLPSRPLGGRTEGTPVAVLEAMRSGTPVVASDTGGVRRAVAGAGALLVRPGDAAALRRALEAVLAVPEVAEEMGRRHVRAATRFGWAVVGRDHVRIGRGLLRAARTTVRRSS